MSERIFTLQELAFSNDARRDYCRLHPQEEAEWREKVARAADLRYKAANAEKLAEKSRARMAEWIKRPGNRARATAAQHARRNAKSNLLAQDGKAPPTGGVSRINKRRDALQPVKFMGCDVIRVIPIGSACFSCGKVKPLSDGQHCCGECFAKFQRHKLKLHERN